MKLFFLIGSIALVSGTASVALANTDTRSFRIEPPATIKLYDGVDDVVSWSKSSAASSGYYVALSRNALCTEVYWETITNKNIVVLPPLLDHPSTAYICATARTNNPNLNIAAENSGVAVPIDHNGVKKIGQVPYGTHNVTFSPDGRNFATASKYIDIYETSTWTITDTLKDHTDGVYDIVFSQNASKLVSIGSDKALRIWQRRMDSDTYELMHTTTLQKTLYKLALSPDDKYIVATAEEAVEVYDVGTGERIASLEMPVSAQAISFRSKIESGPTYTFTVGGRDARLRTYDFNTKTLRLSQSTGGSRNGHDIESTAIAISEKSFDATAVVGGDILIWAGDSIARELYYNQSMKKTLNFTSDNKYLVVGLWAAGCSYAVFDTELWQSIGRCRFLPAAGVNSATISKDNRTLVLGFSDGSIWTIDYLNR